MKKSKIYNFSDDDFTKIIKESFSYRECCENQCALYGNKGEWNNKPLTLQLDHINGNHQDYRLENLRLLCPNCHSQIETFSSRQCRAKSIEKQ